MTSDSTYGLESTTDGDGDVVMSETGGETEIKKGSEEKSDGSDDDSDSESHYAIPGATLGYDPKGERLPGFVDVVDELLLFTCDSDFTIYNRYISGDTPLQRLVAVKKLSHMLPRFGCEGAYSLLDRVLALAVDKELIIRQACAEQLGLYAKYLVESSEAVAEQQRIDRAKAKSLPIEEVPPIVYRRGQRVIVKKLLPLIVDMLRDSMEVRQAAGNALIMMAELLSKDEVNEHVLKIVLHMAHDDTDDQKISSLPLLAELAPIVGGAVCKNYLSHDLAALSQDNSFRVRKATVSYFGALCEQLGPEEAAKTLLPTFVSLTDDSIWSVRKGCVEAFVSVTSAVDQDTRLTMIPVMKKMCKDSSRWVRNAAYEQLGAFIATLVSEQIDSEFLALYCNIPQLPTSDADADCVNHCAFSFPGVALALGPERWPELNETYHVLVRKTFKTRKTMAASIHEICHILGTEMTEEYLLPALEFFLKDIDEIRQGMIKNLWRILQVLSPEKRREHLKTLKELGVETDANWRFRLFLAEQLDDLIEIYEPEDVIEELTDLVFRLCDDRMAVVRYAAVDGVKGLVEYFTTGPGNPSASASDAAAASETGDDGSAMDLDKSARENLHSVLDRCYSLQSNETYMKRLLYIRMCGALFHHVSHELFAEHFLAKLLELASDPVSNVRLALSEWIYENLWKTDGSADISVDVAPTPEEKTRAVFRVRDDVKSAVEILRDDKTDVDIMRYFSTDEEIATWILNDKERRKKEDGYTASAPKAATEVDLVNESDDSSLYSSDEEEGDGEVRLFSTAGDTAGDTVMDPGATLEEEASPGLDGLVMAGPHASAEDGELAKKNREDYEQSKKEGTDFDQGLIHQPTPYRLPGLDDEDKGDEDPSSSAMDADPSADDDPISAAAAEAAEPEEASAPPIAAEADAATGDVEIADSSGVEAGDDAAQSTDAVMTDGSAEEPSG